MVCLVGRTVNFLLFGYRKSETNPNDRIKLPFWVGLNHVRLSCAILNVGLPWHWQEFNYVNCRFFGHGTAGVSHWHGLVIDVGSAWPKPHLGTHKKTPADDKVKHRGKKWVFVLNRIFLAGFMPQKIGNKLQKNLWPQKTRAEKSCCALYTNTVTTSTFNRFQQIISIGSTFK
jgi:hypothetical protein